MYIKLDNDMNLVITVNEPIYRGDNLNRKIIYLVPLTVGEIDVLTASVYLNYIRADGTPDIIILERMDELYKEAYYQFTVPVTCKLTKYAGEVCSWLQVFAGTPSNPTTSKSGECMLYILESKNMDEYLCDHQITAIYQLQKQIDDPDDTDETPDWEDMEGSEEEDTSTPDWEDMDSSSDESSDSSSSGDSWEEVSET